MLLLFLYFEKMILSISFTKFHATFQRVSFTNDRSYDVDSFELIEMFWAEVFSLILIRALAPLYTYFFDKALDLLAFLQQSP